MFTPLQILGNSLSEWSVLVIAAFGGGAFGAALGALPAFIFTGFMVVAGEGARLLQASLSEAGVVGEEAGSQVATITNLIAFGPVFGPHVAFAAGAAATAYAARKGYMDTGFDYHEGKNILYALGTRPDVLAVGGVFGILGMFVRQVSGGLALPWDPIAMGVVISAVAHRLAFGYPMIGRARGDGLLDMSPFGREEMRGEVADRPAADGGTDGVEADGGTADADRLAVEPWLPHQYKWPNVAMLGLAVGILGAYIAVVTGSAFLAFGISAATLVFLNAGVENIPVTHHISIVASAGALALVEAGTPETLPALVVGAVFGIYAALAGEVVQRIFYAHSDTHFDPPAAAIVIGTFTIAVLAILGVLPGSSYVPLPV